MSDGGKQGRKISVKEFLLDFRGGKSDADLRDKYGLSAQNFIRLLKELTAKRLVTPDDLETRRTKAIQQAKAKELEFLAGLFICPKCGHPATQAFEICPACEIHVDEYLSGQHALSALSDTGTNFYVEEAENDVIPRPISNEEPEPDLQRDVTPDLDTEPEPEPEPPQPADLEEGNQQQTKKSALDSVRSLFGGRKKK
ncbi:MAG: hypothetical protein AB1646_03340 [Thermodesulfobacteriota bacterium]